MSKDLQIQDERSAEAVRYERGVSLREVAKSTLLRFLPGSLLSMGGLAAAMNLEASFDILAAAGSVLGFAGLMTLGFGTGLIALRRWLFPDAEITGRRSFLAGALLPLALFIVAVLSSGLNSVQVAVVLVLVGVLMALGMFFAWLSPTPEEMLGAAYRPSTPENVSKLPELSLVTNDSNSRR